MSNRTKQPIERLPSGLRLPPFWHALHNYGRAYRPQDKPKQEDWGTVADKFHVDVGTLIHFNFLTKNPDEVNWYLKRYVGCNKVSPSGNNWMFSNSASPGIIYIPPPDVSTVAYPPEDLCVWGSDQIKQFLQRLRVVAYSIKGNDGARIKKLVDIALRVGYPGCLDLWYYNDMNIASYLNWRTTGAKLKEMTKSTQGNFPFNGESGLYDQSYRTKEGGFSEIGAGMWRVHPFKELFDEFACGGDANDLRESLKDIDKHMYRGWYEMQAIAGRTVGVNPYDPAVELFLHHVKTLTLDNNHLYAAFRAAD